MQKLKLSEKMKTAMRALYEADDNSGYVSYPTAVALQRRGLIEVPRTFAQRTAGGQFPEYRVALSQSGREWCEEYIARVPRADHVL